LPEHFKDSKFVFLANSSPVVQSKVLDQVKSPEMVLADTMDLWIDTQKDDLLKLLPRLDGLLINDSEAILLTGEPNLVLGWNGNSKVRSKVCHFEKRGTRCNAF